MLALTPAAAAATIAPRAAASDRVALDATRVTLAVPADWSGGWQTHKNPRSWRRIGNHCRPYDGPHLAALVVACDAPDGSHWALQQWQPKLPHRGFPS
jgi:hypothetical protein